MPHDATPRNGRMYESGVPAWMVALALAIVFSTAAAVLAATTGFALLPALAVAALGYGLYLVIAARRRRARFKIGEPWQSVIDDGRALRRRMRRYRYRGVP